MTEPTEFELLELAAPYALHAVSDAERAEIDSQVAAAPASVAAAFQAEVRAVRETMAVLASASVAEPPDRLRVAVLAASAPQIQRQSGWRTRVLAAAAAVVIGLAGFGLGWLARPHTTPTMTEQVMSAPDMKSVSGPLGAGTATVIFSRDRNAAVLVMNNVAPPSPGTVYQMWLIGSGGAKSAGTMNAAAVQPTTTAMVGEIGTCRALAFTVEPGTGSLLPTTPILAELALK